MRPSAAFCVTLRTFAVVRLHPIRVGRTSCGRSDCKLRESEGAVVVGGSAGNNTVIRYIICIILSDFYIRVLD